MNELRHSTLGTIAQKYLEEGALNNPKDSADALQIVYLVVKPGEFRTILEDSKEWEEILATPFPLMRKHGLYCDAFLSETIGEAIKQKKNVQKIKMLDLVVKLIKGRTVMPTWKEVDESGAPDTKTFSSKIKELCEGPEKFEINSSSMEIINLVEEELTDLISGIESRLGSRPKILTLPSQPTVIKQTTEYLTANEDAQKHQQNLFCDFLALQDILAPALPAMRTAMHNVFDILRSGWLSEKVDVQVMVQNLEHMELSLLKMDAPEMNVVICGESCTGKSTMLEGILGSPCLPTNVHPNTACPIRIMVKNELAGPEMFIPSTFCFALNSAMSNVLDSMIELKANLVPYNDIHIPAVEAAEMFEHLHACVVSGKGHEDVYVFPTSINGPSNIQACINKINGIVRLVYVLKAIPRFRERLSATHPLSVFLTGAVVSKLPTISSPCSCTFGLPLYGKLSFIDTPGVSEFTGFGSFMTHIDELMNRLLSEASSIILLTTPDKISNENFRQWRKKAKARRPESTIIVINKFDQVRDADVAVKLNEFRRNLDGKRHRYFTLFNNL